MASVPFLPTINFQSSENNTPEELLKKYLPVNFKRDGLDLSPELYAQLLQTLSRKKDFKPDSYGSHGMIEAFEQKVADKLGKESAVYMPTGTMANHIALRNHCIEKKRAIVQYESHINRDTGDCVSNLSGINLLTLGQERVIFDIDDIEKIFDDTKNGKVKTPIGALSLETPVRRKHLMRVPFESIKEMTEIARKHNIALHLDGARVFIDAAFSGHKVIEYTSLFDTVYLSLYKSFNTIGGAILAGPKEFIKDLSHQRRMFGGTFPSSWQQIAVANYFLDNYESRYEKALSYFKIFKSKLEESGKFKIEELPNGSSILKLIPKKTTDIQNFIMLLKKHKINMPDWITKDQCFYIKINDSLVYADIEEVANTFIHLI